MPSRSQDDNQVFKTSWFVKAARKANISDAQLCKAIAEVMKGQCDDLGGGVLKKRLNKNMNRSIILARGKRVWVYQYLFAKKDRANIDDDELASFRVLAKSYEKLTGEQLNQLIRNGDLTEICHGDKA